MESPMDKLLKKYWAGETSLKEEQAIRSYFQENPNLTAQSNYFRALESMRKKPDVAFSHPEKARRVRKTQWSVAATIFIGILAAALIVRDVRQQQREFAVDDPKEAYEITRKALLMISSGLNQGKVYSQEINHINKAEEIIQTDGSPSAN